MGVKYVVVILDGASDLPIGELGGRTCLQAADTPNLDAMAREGIVGLVRTVPVGVEPSSSAACMSILGYDPIRQYIGRGAIEAASMGIDLGPDQVALRLNLVSIRNGLMQSYSGGNVPTMDSRKIVAELSDALDDDTFQLFPGVAYRHILVVSGYPELLEAVYTPPHDISDKAVDSHIPRGPGSDLLLNYIDRARAILARSAVIKRRTAEGNLPITDVWPFWPGAKPAAIPSFVEHHGVTAAISSGVDLLGGLATLTGVKRLHVQGVTDGQDNDYRAQALGSITALSEHDVVIIHVESPDEAGHAGDMETKIAAIEAIDREIVSRIRDIEGRIRVLAMPDHATPIQLKTHVGIPVPFVLWGDSISPNGADSYSEDSALRSGLMLDPGHRVMDVMLGNSKNQQDVSSDLASEHPAEARGDLRIS